MLKKTKVSGSEMNTKKDLKCTKNTKKRGRGGVGGGLGEQQGRYRRKTPRGFADSKGGGVEYHALCKRKKQAKGELLGGKKKGT